MATPPAPDRTPSSHRGERTRLGAAMAANVLMFVVGLAGWRLAHSTALLADAFDMLADATGYGSPSGPWADSSRASASQSAGAVSC